jgi:hypothetical protein
MYTAVVVADTTITWDTDTFVLKKGAVLDLMSGGALETAIGTGNLSALPAGSDQDLPPAAGAVDN